MKKLLLSILTLFIIAAGTTYGQEDPAKALKKASRALGAYNLSPSDNGDKLKEAIDMIEIAGTDDAVKATVKYWQTKGEVYGTILQQDMNQLLVNPEHVVEQPEAGITAMEAYKMALSKAEKKFEKSDAVDGLSECSKSLNYVGNSQIQSQNYAAAFKTLNTVLENNSLVKENGGTPAIADGEVNNQKYIVAFCADAAKNTEVAERLFKDLYEAEYEEAGVYARYFTILSAKGDEGAITVLEKGREKFPSDTEILFTEINYYIQREQYDVLEVKLREAIEREPNNPSAYSALGNVYMNLFTEEYGANGDTDKGQGYFDNAIKYFQGAIDINAKQLDAIYSIGSLYFNKAVEVVKKMADLGMSKDDQVLYEKYKNESDELFKASLPFFQKAESIDANDTNTLIALSEIFARTQDFEKSGEFKKRLQVVKDGGKNEASYFNE